MLSIQLRRSVFVRKASVFAVFAGAACLGAQAQEAAAPQTGVANPTLFASVNTRPIDLAEFAGVNYSSSSSDSAVTGDGTTADPGTLDLSAAGIQPPPRRRYGRPRYSDSSHNADGSNKYVFVGAAGMTLPTGDTFHYFNTNYAFQVGGGRQFNRHFAVLAQFDYDRFGVNKATLDNQSALYIGQPCTPATVPNGGCGVDIDADNHVWSFTVNPTYTFAQGDKYGAYIVGGIGFYHKVTNFTTPETETFYYYGFPEEYTANAVFDHYTSNAVGYNGGIGITYKFSRFADERFFIEGRYVFVDNSQRQGYTYATSNASLTGSSANDFFPANSNRTTYIPVKVGIRF